MEDVPCVRLVFFNGNVGFNAVIQRFKLLFNLKANSANQSDNSFGCVQWERSNVSSPSSQYQMLNIKYLSSLFQIQ